MASVLENTEKILKRLYSAAQKSGRDPESIVIVAVSKFHSVERIREAAQAGLKVFGESRVQEAQTKLPLLKDLGQWHFIGNLQSNKARVVAELFDVVQSVDDTRLAEKLSSLALDFGKTLGVYAQVNISREAQKHGFALEGAEQEILKLSTMRGLRLEGLMGMAAASENPEDARPSFQALAQLRQRLAAEHPGLKLSMGMSQDFEIAIEEGADLIRIGTALFQ
jgi:pyridoxal phosphate enzyme (YggS family)